MNCTVCSCRISPRRLELVPDTQFCTGCLEKLGDVKPIRRFDDYAGKEGEIVAQSYYFENQYFDAAFKRLSSLGRSAFGGLEAYEPSMVLNGNNYYPYRGSIYPVGFTEVQGLKDKEQS